MAKIFTWIKNKIWEPILTFLHITPKGRYDNLRSRYFTLENNYNTSIQELARMTTEYVKLKDRFSSIEGETIESVKKTNIQMQCYCRDTQNMLAEAVKNAEQFRFAKNQVTPGSTRVCTETSPDHDLLICGKTVIPKRAVDEILFSDNLSSQYLTALSQLYKFGGHDKIFKKLVEYGIFSLVLVKTDEPDGDITVNNTNYDLYWALNCDIPKTTSTLKVVDPAQDISDIIKELDESENETPIMTMEEIQKMLNEK